MQIEKYKNLLLQKLNTPVIRRYRKQLRRFWQDHHWTVVLLAAFLITWMGMIGLKNVEGFNKPAPSFWDRLYLTFQMFYINCSLPNGDKPFILHLARFVAPFITFYAAIRGLMVLFQEKMQLVFLSFYKRHTLVCGLGEKGRQLVSDLLEKKEKVVVLEINPDNKYISTFRNGGAIVLVGDATNKEMLEQARVERAEKVFAVCADDKVNLEIALHARQQVADYRHGSVSPSSASTSPWRCFVHLTDTNLRDLLSQQTVFEHSPLVTIRCFNAYENGAREFFEKFPPEISKAEFGQNEIHLLIIGFGRMGQSIALQAARVCHYPDGKPVRITVVDRQAIKLGESFLARYAMFRNICQIEFLDLDIDDASFIGGEFITPHGGSDSVTQTIVCLESETAALLCALHLRKVFKEAKCHFYVRAEMESKLLTILQQGAGTFGNSGQESRFHAFGSIAATCTHEIVEGEKEEKMAKQIHAAYVAAKLKLITKEEDQKDPSLKPWDELTPDLRESNRQQYEHWDFKLRAIGCKRCKNTGEGIPVTELSKEEIEQLAIIEHNRWNAERWLAGWQWAKERDIIKKTSPYLVPWDDEENLPEKIKEYDRKAVQIIPSWLKELGETVVRTA